jgi:hypothetical protein
MNNWNRKKRSHSKNIVFIALALFCMVATLAGCRGKTDTSTNANTSEAVVSQTDDIRETDAPSQSGIVTDKPADGDESKQPGDEQKPHQGDESKTQKEDATNSTVDESKPSKEEATGSTVDESKQTKNKATDPVQDDELKSSEKGKTESEETGTQDNSSTPDDTTVPSDTGTYPDPDGTYDSKDDVALYLHTYGHLPNNYITKKQAKELGWSGGSLKEYAPGKCIGGDYFGNYEELLPDADYHECDIGTLGKKSRGAKRIIWDDDGNIYYTDDHYESFEKLY